jgi:SPP1 gp7 family putative phage head morphogenesis protein
MSRRKVTSRISENNTLFPDSDFSAQKIQNAALNPPPKKGGGGVEGIMTKIVRESYSYVIPDITRWKAAVSYAKQPKEQRRYNLIDVYDNAMGNIDLLAAVDLRIRRATKSKFRLVDKNGKEDKEKTKILNTPWFRNEFLKKALESIFYGYTLIEMQVFDGQFVGAKVVDRKNVVPNVRVVLPKFTDSDANGISYDAEEYQRILIEVGYAEDLGLLENVSKETIFIKFMENFWLKYAEMFGMPIRVASTASTNPKVWDEIDRMLDSMADAMWMRLPAQTDFKLFNEGGHDAYNVYERFCARKDAQINKLILGGTLINSTSSNGSGGTYAQSQTHLQIADDVMESDRQFLADIVNTQLLPLAVEWGYPFDGCTFQFDPEDKISLVDLWTIVAGVISNNYKVPAEFITEKFGIPIIEDAPPPPPNPNTKVRNFQKAFPQPATGENAYKTSMGRIAVANIDYASLDSEFEQMLTDLYNGNITENELHTAFYLKLSEVLQGSISEGYKVTIDYNSPDALLIQHLQTNLFALSAAKTYDELVELRDLLTDADGNVRTFQDFKTDAATVGYKYNVTYLKAEYDTAIGSAQMASKWVQINAEKDILPNLQYKAVQDDRTREEHARIHNVIFPIDDPFWDYYYPLNGIKCRCYVIQVDNTNTDNKISSADASALMAEKTPPYMKGNVGKEKIIFNDKHPYNESLPTGKVSELSAVKNYGMKTGAKIYEQQSKLPQKAKNLQSNADYKAWIESLAANENGDIVFTTILPLPNGDQTEVFLEKKKAEKTLEDAWQYAHNLEKVLADASEVYRVKKGSKLETTYVKYFKETPIIVTVSEGKILSMKEMSEKDIDDYRVGILMKR